MSNKQKSKTNQVKKDIDNHISYDKQKIQTYDEYWANYLLEIGIPLAPDGTPLGVGWD